MPWSRPAQRVLIVLAGGLLAYGASLGGTAARRPVAVAVPDEPRLEVRLDLNRASVADLETLPGVGAALAARIAADRGEHGPFRSVDDLGRVAGIREKLVAALRPLLTVEPAQQP